MRRGQSIKQIVWIVAGVTIGYLLSGCSLFAPVKTESSRALINELPAGLPQRTTQAATLLVLKPLANPIFDTTQIAYMSSPHDVNYFNKQMWAATPSQMVLPLLTATMERAGYFTAVLTPPYFGDYDYALGSKILVLAQDFTTQPAILKLSIRVQLSRGSSGEVIASRVIELREPLQQDNSAAGVLAANKAMAKALREIADFVLTAAEQNSR